MADDLAEKVWGQLAGGWQNGRDATAARLAFEALLARLTTAETERDEWRVTAETLRDMENEAAKGLLRRVEALSEALREIADGKPVLVDGVTYVRPGQERARAALACPPQQRGE